MPIFTSDLTSRGIIYADTITTNSNEDLTLNPAGTGAVVANARLKVNEISADDSSAVSFKSPLQLDSTLQTGGSVTMNGQLFTNALQTAYRIKLEGSGSEPRLDYVNTDFGTFGWQTYQTGAGSLSWTVTGTGGAEMTLSSDGVDYQNATLSVGNYPVITTGGERAIVASSWLRWADNAEARFGTGDDLKIYHTGSDSVIADVGSGDLYIKGSNNVWIQGNSTNHVIAKFSETGSIGVAELYYNNSKVFETVSGGISVTGDIAANDIAITGNIDLTSNGTITIGSGDSTADLTLTHDGTDVYLTKAGTSGEVYVRGRNISLQNDDGTQTFVTAGHGGATELYHGGLGSPGLVTTVSGGISIPNGTLLVNTIASGDSTSVRINDSIETDGLTVNGTVSINNVQLAEINNTQVDSAVEDIDTWSATTYRAAKYVYRIKNTSTSEYQSGEIMVLHDGSTAQIAEYSLLKTGNNDLITFSVDIDAGNVRLRGSAQATGSDIKLLRTLIED